MVGAYLSSLDDGIPELIYEIRFYDNEENLLYSFNATRGSRNTDNDYNLSRTANANFQTFEIGDNEELIGVYGVAGKESWITSFGFIVKVKASA